MEEYHADDSLIAPDGQIALRLAADNGHREVVEYLPARRGGGFRRWKYKNRTAIRRAKRAGKAIGTFVKFFVWDIEKFFLWTVPKHTIVKPLMKACTWAWENRKAFGPWCVRQVREFPARVERFVKALGRGIVRIGKGLRDLIVEIPKLLKRLVLWIWKVLTVNLPKTVVFLAKMVGNGLASIAKVIWNAVLKVVSFLSTLVEAIVSFFRSLTLKDVWNGFCDALRAVFVALPKLIGHWIANFGESAYRIMKMALGEIGEILWYIGYGLIWVVMFIPRKIWVLLESFGNVLVRGGHEIRVWIDPKAS